MKLCLTLAESRLSLLERKIALYDAQADVIEARLDYLERPQPPRLPPDRRALLLATCRPLREGGRFAGEEGERLRILKSAAEKGFDWIDLEGDASTPESLPSGVRILRSHHSFDSFPASLDAIAERLESRGDAFKIAVAVEDSSRMTRLLDWMESMSPDRRRIIIGMGEYGQPTRILGGFLGNAWQYVCEDKDAPPAPGQFSLDQARSVYRLQQRESAPTLYAVMGKPVAHSLSPLLHNALLERYGLAGLYLPLPLTSLAPWFRYLDRSPLHFGGFSVTIPYKVDVIEHLTRNDSPIESVNTLIPLESGWRGLNTDYEGFLNPLRRRIELKGKQAVVLGLGGVARTAVRVLQDSGCQVLAVGRESSKAERFGRLAECSTTTFSDLSEGADICVNTTPVGQHPDVDAAPIDPCRLRFSLVYDLVYRPRRTRLIELASQQGASTISGLEMFAEQAALQFRSWTGVDPDRDWIGGFLASV